MAIDSSLWLAVRSSLIIPNKTAFWKQKFHWSTLVLSDIVSGIPMSGEQQLTEAELLQQLQTLNDLESGLRDAPISVEPAAVTEYRRILEGRDPQDVLAKAETLLGGLWKNQCTELKTISQASPELKPEQVLAGIASERVLPGNQAFVNLETYLHEMYAHLVDQGWKFQIEETKLENAQDQLAVALAGLTDGNEYDVAVEYLPPKPYQVKLPTINITNTDGQSVRVFITSANHQVVGTQQSHLDQGKVVYIVEKGGNSYITSHYNVIQVDASGFDSAQRIYDCVSTLIHEIDHSVQRLLSNNRNPRVGTIGMAHRVVIEGSSITSQRIFASRLSNILRKVVPADQNPIIEHAMKNLHALIQSRSPCDRFLFYAAGKILFNRFGIDQALMTGQMPGYINLLEQISINLSTNPEIVESLFETVMQDKWKLLLAQAFSDHAPLSLTTQDEMPDSFRVMFIRDNDLRLYFKVKLTNTADQVKDDYDELGANEEAQKKFIARTLSGAFANSVYGQTMGEGNKADLIKTISGENKLQVMLFWLTEMLPTHDFAIKCWQNLQNPDPEKEFALAQSILG